MLCRTGAAAGDDRAEPLTHPPIPVTLTLSAPQYVTLVIENAQGVRVRNLVSETPFPAGVSTLYWDGLDDLGRDTEAAAHAVYHVPGALVAAGEYRVRGLARPGIDLRYQMTAYHSGNPPWLTSDRSSAWLANHTPPSAILYVPDGAAPTRAGHPAVGGQLLVGSFVSEGGSGLAWLNLEGKKIHGQEWVGGVWTGATQICRDEGEMPIPGVYAYTGSAWRGDQFDGNRPELRLHMLVNQENKPQAPRDTRMGSGEDPPVLKPNFLLPADLPDPEHGGVTVLGGLAARNGILVAAVSPMNQLVFVDVAAHKTIAVASIQDPRGIAFDHQGRLLILSGKQIVRASPPTLDRAAATTQPIVLADQQALVGDGLEDPKQIAVDRDGTLYVSDWGKSHQVKKFSPAGKLLGAIGAAGGPAVGPYDPTRMQHPNGLTLDGQGRLWVAETDDLPKRLSVWSTEGKLLAAYYGPPHYGGGGSLDSTQIDRLFYADSGGGMQFKLDWNRQTSVPIAVYHRPEFDALAGSFRNENSAGPETPLHAEGRAYLTDCYTANPTGGVATSTLWMLRESKAVPVACVGEANNLAAFNSTARFSVRWTGSIRPPTEGPWTFYLSVDDGTRLWIDGKMIIDSWRNNSPESKAVVDLTAGKRHDLKLEYFNDGGRARAVLQWESPGHPRQTIPMTALFPPDAAASATEGTGLAGEYFSDIRLNHLAARQVDGAIDNDWGESNLKAIPSPLATRLPAGVDLGRDRVVFAWSDVNGDGQVQPEEVTCIKGETLSVNFRDDCSVVTGAGWMLKPTRFTEAGAPVYDLASITTIVAGFNRPVSSGGGQAVLGADGAFAFTNAPAPLSAYGIGGGRDGRATWSYPSLWPGLHASHIAPMPEQPGELIGTTRLLGLPVKPAGSDLGEVFAVNGNKGNVYLFTTDGLFVATLFRDSRTASWEPTSTAAGTVLNDQSIKEEDFFPTLNQSADGKIYLSVLNCCLVQVAGLQNARRIPEQKLTVTAEHLKAARTYFADREAARQSKAAGVLAPLSVSIVEARPDWSKAKFATIDERQTQQGDWGREKAVTSGAVAVNSDRLFAAFVTDDANLLNNSGESPQNLFKTGGCLDLMIGADATADPNRRQAVEGDERLLVTRVKTKPMALLYRQISRRAKGAAAEFTSPVMSVHFDSVQDVTDKIELTSVPLTNKDGRPAGVRFEFSIGLDVLGLRPAKGQTVRGDIGVLRGNGFQTMQRVYWSNKAAGLVSDLPSEAELTPRLWGTWKFE